MRLENQNLRENDLQMRVYCERKRKKWSGVEISPERSGSIEPKTITLLMNPCGTNIVDFGSEAMLA